MRFYLVDVFAEQKYQGNQLAVFLPDKELSTKEMQQIAKETNFSETSFILSDQQADGGYHVRIFTPDVEVPFAGHPSLGTAYVIRELLEEKQSDRVLLNLEVGQIPVTFTGDQLFMEQKQPTFGERISRETMADILQINQADIHPDFPVQVVSTGLPSVIVPLQSLAAVKKAAIHHARFQAFLDDVVKANLLIFVPETEKPENDLHVRMFMDDPGFLEDPATGSANGNLAGYLLEYDFFQQSKLQLQVEQGYQINRPSLLKIAAEKDEEAFRIHVGGKVFLVAKGEWF